MIPDVTVNRISTRLLVAAARSVPRKAADAASAGNFFDTPVICSSGATLSKSRSRVPRRRELGPAGPGPPASSNTCTALCWPNISGSKAGVPGWRPSRKCSPRSTTPWRSTIPRAPAGAAAGMGAPRAPPSRKTFRNLETRRRSQKPAYPNGSRPTPLRGRTVGSLRFLYTGHGKLKHMIETL